MPRPPAEDYELCDKSNPFGKVSSRVDETPVFEALENSTGGSCHLASNKHPRLKILDIGISSELDKTVRVAAATWIACASLLGGA